MADDFEDDNLDWGEDGEGWEPTEQEIAEIERAMQDMRDGFGYEWLHDEEGEMVFKCMKCGRTADLHERPFPHKLDCPMRKYYGDKDAG
jgi:hypothetical protein